MTTNRPPLRTTGHVVGLDHVQLAMPPGGEELARSFYNGVLGLTEDPKPEPLASRGGVWFRGGGGLVHLGAEADFRPARKAHPALLVEDVDACRADLEAAGHPCKGDDSLEGRRRFYTEDPFGNRIELIQRGDGLSER